LGQKSTIRLSYTHSLSSINSQDALDALKLSVGLPISNGTNDEYEFIAADFNQDGMVLSQDALSILKYSVGLETLEEAKWVFVDTNSDYSSLSRFETDYTEGMHMVDLTEDVSIGLRGVLIGDVNRC
jgi:hypothetical protein